MDREQTEEKILLETVVKYIEKEQKVRVIRKKLTLTIDAEILEKAKNLGVNISALTENALRIYVKWKQESFNEDNQGKK